MREIKFRGMPKDRDGFRYGDLFISCDGTCFIQYDWQEYGIGETNEVCGDFESYEVYSKTIGQYTGLNDKNGKEIYEGDIIEVDTNITTDWEKHRFKIINVQGAFCITNDKTQGVSRVLNNSICDDVMTLFELWWYNTEDTGDNHLTFVEIIGNIHENPELLEE